MPQKQKMNSGFTLLEILIALAISGLILAGTLQVFDYSNKSYVLQEDVAQMQQNARVAKYYIEKDLRIAGMNLSNIALDAELIYPINFQNNVNETGKLANSDYLSVSYLDLEASSCGTSSTGVPSCDSFPQLILGDKMLKTEATVAEVEPYLKDHPPFSMWAEDCWCDGTLYDKYGFMAIITSADGSKSDIVFITHVDPKKDGSDSKLSAGPNFTFEGNTYDNKLLNDYDEGSTINFFNSDSIITMSYFVDSDYNLIRQTNGTNTVIAENIEDFQVSFWGDFNEDGTLNLQDVAGNEDWIQDASAVNMSVVGSNSLPNIEKIRFVKFSVLARTSKEHPASKLKSTRPALEDHAAALTSDYYQRRPISVTVRIRNLGLDENLRVLVDYDE